MTDAELRLIASAARDVEHDFAGPKYEQIERAQLDLANAGRRVLVVRCRSRISRKGSCAVRLVVIPPMWAEVATTRFGPLAGEWQRSCLWLRQTAAKPKLGTSPCMAFSAFRGNSACSI